MKFGLGLFSDKPTRTLAEQIALAEKHGFDYAWVSNQFFNRNVFVTLTYAATITKSIRLGTGVVDPYFRHPSILAAAAASLNEVSNGRAILGIGSGMVEGPETSPAYPLSHRLRIGNPLPTTREAIQIVKGLWTGESLTFVGGVFKLTDAKLRFPRMKIPVYVGARRKLMFRLAGELAEGVLTHGIDEAYLKYVGGQVRKGAEKSQRSPSEIDIATWAYLSTSVTSERVRTTMREYSAWLAESLPEEAVPHMNLGQGALERIRAIKVLTEKGRYEEAATLVDDKLVDAMHIFGDKRKCIDSVEAIGRSGATQLVVAGIDDEIEKVIEFAGKEVIPSFR